MGSLNSVKDTVLGEFEMKGQTGELPIDCIQATRFSIIVQDKAGKPHFEMTKQLPAGEQILSFEFDELDSGTYDAWIEADGKTFIRSLVIPAARESSLLKKLKSLFLSI